MRPDPSVPAEADAEEVLPSRRGWRLARLAFVLALTPGLVITMVLAPALRSPTLLALGVALTLAAYWGRHRLTAAIVALYGGPAGPGLPHPTSEIP